MKLPIKNAKNYLSKYNLNDEKSFTKAFNKAYKDFAAEKISTRLFSAIAHQLRIALQNDLTTSNLELVNAIESASELYFLHMDYPNLAHAENNLRKYFH